MQGVKSRAVSFVQIVQKSSYPLPRHPDKKAGDLSIKTACLCFLPSFPVGSGCIRFPRLFCAGNSIFCVIYLFANGYSAVSGHSLLSVFS